MSTRSTTTTTAAASAAALQPEYAGVRAATVALCAPLAVEDHVVQTMADVSPPKWHLAHTTWFFETFVLAQFVPDYRPVHPLYRTLFNSYYEAVGARHPRAERGLLSRPTVREVLDYRRHVDARIHDLLLRLPAEHENELCRRLVLGLHHEQQHQELLLVDIKHIFATNPLQPVYRAAPTGATQPVAPLRWHPFAGGLLEFGHAGPGFAFDNESPRHRVFLAPFALADRCVSNGEYLEFIAEGGYERPELWLADGWAAVANGGWRAPLYWQERDGAWFEFTLSGSRPLRLDEPVVHVSYYEADAFARWRQARLPSEFEWELAAQSSPREGNFVESGALQPRPAHAPALATASGRGSTQGLRQIFGDVWELTRSDYAPYPGYRAPRGALGEYNGKFMSGQVVLRGGSCATPRSHIRATYRNFFYPHQRWNFQGLRLAQDA